MRARSILFLTLFLQAFLVFSKEVTVREVTLSLHNHPVTGYRMILDRDLETVSQKIIQHVKAYGDFNPFKYERTIIYEHIRYRPINQKREFSLYYLLRPVPGELTELTFVAMYDYTRSVSLEAFPDYSAKVLVDLARMTKAITGDMLKFQDMLFNEEALRKLSVDPLALRNDPKQSKATFYPEEETDSPDVRLNSDPFRTRTTRNKDSLIHQLARQVKELERRERDLMAREKQLRKDIEDFRRQNGISPGAPRIISNLQDSIRDMRQRLMELARLVHAPDDISFSSDQSEVIDQLEKEILGREDLMRRNLIRMDSLKRSNEYLSNELQKLLVRKEVLDQSYTELEEENKRLKNQLQALNQGESVVLSTPALEDTVKLLRARIRDLSRRREGGDSANPGSQSLALENQRLKNKISGLEKKNRETDTKYREAIRVSDELETNLRNTLSSLKEMVTRYSTLQETVERYEREIKKLQSDLRGLRRQVQLGEGGTTVMQDSLRKILRNNKKMETMLARKNRQARYFAYQRDSAIRMISLRRERENRLIKKLDSLYARMDSFRVEQGNSENQQRFIQEQWAKLEQWNRELEEEEKKMKDREKLVASKEIFLDNKEKELNSREKKYNALLARENEIKLAEQKLGLPGNSTSNQSVNPGAGSAKPDFKLSSGKVSEYGKLVPVYLIRIDQDKKASQKQIAGYMLSRGYLYEDKYPDLLYEKVRVPDISDRQLEFKFRIQQQAGYTLIKVSARTQGGQYISPGAQNKASNGTKQFLNELFRF